MRNLFGTLALVGLLAACAADDDAEEIYERWDTDLDARLSRAEFVAGAERSGFFDSWDRDDDARLSREEFEEGVGGLRGEIAQRTVFGEWDENEDRFLSRAEAHEGAFNAFDVNDNGYISEDEFRAGVALLDLG